MDLLQMARDRRLVQFGENVRDRVGFICNCCGCCCEAMIAARRFGFLHPVHTTNWLPEVDEAQCNGCGKCVEACPVEAMALVSANDPRHPKRKRARSSTPSSASAAASAYGPAPRAASTSCRAPSGSSRRRPRPTASC